MNIIKLFSFYLPMEKDRALHLTMNNPDLPSPMNPLQARIQKIFPGGSNLDV